MITKQSSFDILPPDQSKIRSFADMVEMFVDKKQT